MLKNKNLIFGITFFVLVFSGLIYYSFFASNGFKEGRIKMLEVSGNKILSEEQYLSFSRLSKNLELNLPVEIITDRFEKHPYISEVETEYKDSKAVVSVVEKRFIALIIIEDETYLLSDEYQVLPVFKEKFDLNLPVILNYKSEKKVKPLDYLDDNEVITAFRIIEAARLTNEAIFTSLSDINLNFGNEIVLSFNGIRPPVILGRGDIAKKMVYLDVIWTQLVTGESRLADSEYIDLRFSNEIIIGNLGKQV